MKAGLALALVLAFPASADAACSRTKGQPLRTDSDLTLDYLICKHREQAEALQRLRVTRPPPQDETQIPDGALDRLGRRTDPFGDRSRRAQQSLDAMDGLNDTFSDRLKLLQPPRLPGQSSR